MKYRYAVGAEFIVEAKNKKEALKKAEEKCEKVSLELVELGVVDG